MIKSVETNYYEEIAMENGDLYRRFYSGAVWEKLYGNSWETCLSEEEFLEKEYKRFMKNCWNYFKKES